MSCVLATPSSSNLRDCREPGKTLSFGSLMVGDRQPCCVVAEIGQNHNGEIGIAKKLIDMAALCGANAVKIPETRCRRRVIGRIATDLTTTKTRSAQHTATSSILWNCRGNNTGNFNNYAKEKGVLYLCTICDLVSLEQMAPLDLPAYKVASRDITNVPLLVELSRLRRPLVLSRAWPTLTTWIKRSKSFCVATIKL